MSLWPPENAVSTQLMLRAPDSQLLSMGHERLLVFSVLHDGLRCDIH